MVPEAYLSLPWIVELADEFVGEFMELERPVRIELAASAELLQRRRAILLCAASKSGKSQGRFYRALIRKADQRFDAHLERTP